MSEKNQAYSHDADVVGTQPSDDQPPSKEHRDTAYGNAEERNELTPDERAEGLRRTTHDDTRFTRKDGK